MANSHYKGKSTKEKLQKGTKVLKLGLKPKEEGLPYCSAERQEHL